MPTTSPDIQRAIEIIDQRITSLQRIKEMLQEEFGMESYQSSIPKRRKKSKRKEQLIKFLRDNGPSNRKEIREGTKIPIGTLATLLNDKGTFVRSDNGKWQVAAGC